jgi:hypothetical protein
MGLEQRAQCEQHDCHQATAEQEQMFSFEILNQYREEDNCDNNLDHGKYTTC